MVSDESIQAAAYELPLPQEPISGVEIKGSERTLPESLLVQNALWFCRCRWLIIIAFICYGMLGLSPKSIDYLGIRPPGAWPFVIAVVLISFNLFFTVISDIIALSLLAFLAYCLGNTIIHYIFRADLKSDIEFIFSSALGFIILSIGTTTITFVHLLSIPIILFFLIILILISSKQIVFCIKKIKFPFFKLDSNFDYILFFLLLVWRCNLK